MPTTSHVLFISHVWNWNEISISVHSAFTSRSPISCPFFTYLFQLMICRTIEAERAVLLVLSRNDGGFMVAGRATLCLVNSQGHAKELGKNLTTEKVGWVQLANYGDGICDDVGSFSSPRGEGCQCQFKCQCKV